jgi:hypothetical protein
VLHRRSRTSYNAHLSFGPCVTLDDVAGRLAELERGYLGLRDRRAVFLTVYGYMTREMQRRIEARAFADNEWVERYTVAFANLYLEALQAYDRAQPVPKSWGLAFGTAKTGAALVSQDLLLGINAHVNHDLAVALDQVSIEPDRLARHADHTAVNEVLRAVTDAVADRVSQLYARGLSGVDTCAGTLDEDVSNFSLAIARQNAWESAVALANSRTELERRAVKKLLDVRAAVLARLILAPNISPTVMSACRKVEEGVWWELLNRSSSG